MQSLPNQIHIELGGLATPFFERVQHIHSFDKLGDVHDLVLHGGVNAYLTDARSDGRHRFPVVRIQPLLNPSELKPGKPSSICGKRPDIVVARSNHTSTLSGMIQYATICISGQIGSGASRLTNSGERPSAAPRRRRAQR